MTQENLILAAVFLGCCIMDALAVAAHVDVLSVIALTYVSSAAIGLLAQAGR